VVVLKLPEYDNPTVINYRVAGGVTGAISNSLLKKSQDE
jgi:hypothetical protein